MTRHEQVCDSCKKAVEQSINARLGIKGDVHFYGCDNYFMHPCSAYNVFDYIHKRLKEVGLFR